jgi:hypothetical protein
MPIALDKLGRCPAHRLAGNFRLGEYRLGQLGK